MPNYKLSPLAEEGLFKIIFTTIESWGNDSERLYYGIGSGVNAGESNETRHSSISLDNYFLKVVN
jgi:hypothetical protein